MAGEHILIVDDEAPVRNTIARTLESAGYRCAGAASVGLAREALAQEGFDLVVCDLMMPGESGLALVEEIQARGSECAVLMVTGVDKPEIAHRTARLGASGYLVKPFSRNELLINVDHALETARRQSEAAAAARDRRVADVRDALAGLDLDARVADHRAADLMRLFSEAVGQRDVETGAHIRRIGEISALLGEACGIPEAEVEAIRVAAPMHDVGKVAIPDSILLKPGKLNHEERELVERHAEIGHDILSGTGSGLLDLAAEIALTHHEKVDGSGYPRGLAGEEIPVAGRIVAVADVFDALTSDRPYRAALPTERAVEIMRADRGSHFDPTPLDLLFDHLDDVRAIAGRFADPEPPARDEAGGHGAATSGSAPGPRVPIAS